MIARSRIATIARQLTRSASSSALSPKVLYNSINPHLLEVVLNNEKALNSLDLDMIESLASQIDAWNANSNLKVVVMRGAGKKAFCAGGDVKSLYLAGTSEANKDKQPAILDEFFRKEFTMDYRLTTMKPIQVALWDGIVMGGGVGVSIHSPFRIATENSMFAMPEAKIGFFTDVSGGYFLSRLHDHVGLYLGLTSQRLKGKDLVRAGLANYFIPSARIPELEAALYKSSDPERFTKAGVVSAIQTLAEKVEGPLPNLELIKRQTSVTFSAFSGSSVEQILESLGHLPADNAWAQETLKLLNGNSPLSLKIIFEQIRRAKSMTLREAFIEDFRITQKQLLFTSFMSHPEFFEGVRCLLVDRNDKPKWAWAKPADIKPADLEKFFKPFADKTRELGI